MIDQYLENFGHHCSPSQLAKMKVLSEIPMIHELDRIFFEKSNIIKIAQEVNNLRGDLFFPIFSIGKKVLYRNEQGFAFRISEYEVFGEDWTDSKVFFEGKLFKFRKYAVRKNSHAASRRMAFLTYSSLDEIGRLRSAEGAAGALPSSISLGAEQSRLSYGTGGFSFAGPNGIYEINYRRNLNACLELCFQISKKKFLERKIRLNKDLTALTISDSFHSCRDDFNEPE